MQKIFILAAVLMSQTTFAKSFKADCKGPQSQVSLVSEMATASAQQIQSLEIDGEPVELLKDVSATPFYNDGVIALRVNFGKGLYSSVQINVEKCNDSFQARGNATLKRYVGGFAGTSQENLTCTCELN